MTALFANDQDEAGDDTAAAPGRPPAKVVRLLESYGYRAEAVRRWTPEKAATVLNACKKEEAIALRRAAAVAKRQDETAPRGQPSLVERMEAAASLEQALSGGGDDLFQGIAYTVYVLRDDEARRLAGWLVRLYRGEAK